jgi:predicted dehydrogenase
VALAAQAGTHILVEKPIARTLAEARAMLAVAQEAGVTLMVAENYRFMAAVRQCKALVNGGAVGTLRMVQLQEEAPFRPTGWRNRRALNGGGVFIDDGVSQACRPLVVASTHGHQRAEGLAQEAQPWCC